MGRQYIEGMMELEQDLDMLLQIHLTANHYPPVHNDFIPACKQAIDNANAGEWGDDIELPNGRVLTTGEIVEGLHLECFLEQEGRNNG